MSWDVVVFNLKKRVENVEEVDESILVDIGTNASFRELLTARYPAIAWNENWGKITGSDFTLDISLGPDEESLTNTIFFLDGENAVYELIELCKANGWQAFDTGLGQMLDLEYPERNGYANHRRYVEHIIKRKGV